MATYSWTRTAPGGVNWNSATNSFLLASLQPGQTLTRIRFGWGYGGSTSTSVVPSGIMTNRLTWGLVTTQGNPATDSPPNIITQSNDQAPPTSRWLWWEARSPVCQAWDSAGNTAIWASGPPQELADTRGQVLVPQLPQGEALNLWATWAPTFAWDASGQAQIWMYASVLVRVG